MKLFDESEEAQIWTSRNQRDTLAKTSNQNHRKENLKNFFLATLGPTKLLLGITLVLVIISIIFMSILFNEEKESWNLEFDDFSEEIINIKSDLTDTRSKLNNISNVINSVLQGVSLRFSLRFLLNAIQPQLKSTCNVLGNDFSKRLI